jgi:hypothetical protein
MIRNMLFTSALLFGAMISMPAVAEDLCSSLEGRALKITANGYEGIVAPFSPGLQLSKAADGTYSFESAIQFEGEKLDKFTGKCKNRHVTFKRIREGGFVQDYDGWIFEKGGSAIRGMAGTFMHNGVEKWAWCGQTAIAAPK